MHKHTNDVIIEGPKGPGNSGCFFYRRNWKLSTLRTFRFFLYAVGPRQEKPEAQFGCLPGILIQTGWVVFFPPKRWEVSEEGQEKLWCDLWWPCRRQRRGEDKEQEGDRPRWRPFAALTWPLPATFVTRRNNIEEISLVEVKTKQDWKYCTILSKLLLLIAVLSFIK